MLELVTIQFVPRRDKLEKPFKKEWNFLPGNVCFLNRLFQYLSERILSLKEFSVWENSQLQRNLYLTDFLFIKYRKVASSNTSHLESLAGFFRLLMKGIFGPYLSKYNRRRIYAIIYWSELHLFLIGSILLRSYSTSSSLFLGSL